MTTAVRPSSQRKHAAILAAAEEVFLRDGYLAATMDEVAARSGVSKQTVYAHCGSKEALFVELVGAMTTATGDVVHVDIADPLEADALPEFLAHYADRQLRAVLDPRILRLRRLVIGEVPRFPDLARVLWELGPQRAIAMLAERFGRLGKAGLLTVPDPRVAAEHFNWLVMSAPLNDAMLLGDDGVPDEETRRAHVAEAVRVFLAAYGRASRP